MNTRYKLITSTKDLYRLIKAIKQVGVVSVDFETNAEKIYQDTFLPTVLAITFQTGSSCIIPLAHQDSPLKESWLTFLQIFGRAIIENPEICKMGWNWKFDNQIFQKFGIYSRGTIIDGMLAKYVLNEERPNGLKEMVDRYIPSYAGYDEKENFKKHPWHSKPFEPLCEYAAIDTDMTFRLCTFFEKKLIDTGLYNVYRNMLMPASVVLQSVETHGLEFDSKLNLELTDKYDKLIEEAYTSLSSIKKVSRFIKQYQKDKISSYIEELELEIKELHKSDKPSSARSIKSREDKILNITAGLFTTKKELSLIEPFNFNSIKQLIELLFTHEKGLKYPILTYTKDKKTKRSTDTPSTAEDAMLKLLEHDKYGFVDKLLKLRGLEHTQSSFIRGYQEHLQSDGRIHPSFLIMGTTSGRLSSKNPNAQQIPKKEVNPDVKLQFITPPGKLFLSFDYSQAELRVMAHLAKEKTLLQAFKDGKDLHLTIACKKYGFEYEDILPIYKDETHPEYVTWKVRRKNAKLTVFGLIYGIEAKKLSEQLSDLKMGIVITPEEAQREIDEFFEIYPKIKKFISKSHREMEKEGFVKTLFGRKRRCPNVFSDNYGLYLEALRQSVNVKCQSAASDMALFASILIYWNTKQGKLPPIQEVSTVHDSIYQYSNPEFLNPWTIYQLWNICKNPDTKKYFGFSINDVDMAMDFGVGRTMAEELPYIPGYDYTNMLKPSFDIKQYYEEHKKVKDIDVSEYPKYFPQYFTKKFKREFREQWINIFNNQ